MNTWSDPPRLLEGTTLSDEERRALSAYAAEAPGVERRARMFEGLSQELALRADTASSGSTVRWGAGKLKLVLGAAGLLASAIGLLGLWPRHADQPMARARHAAQAVAAPPLAAELPAPALVPELPAAATPPAKSAAATLPAAATRSALPGAPRERAKPLRLRSEPAALAPSKEALGLSQIPSGLEAKSLNRGSDPVTELALLARARRALLTRPAHALELTEEHARHFPRGTFGEEREVLAIEALLRLGLDDEAKQRAMAFEQHFPNSAHRAHLARMIRPFDP